MAITAMAPPQRLLRALIDCTQPLGSTLEGPSLQAVQVRGLSIAAESELMLQARCSGQHKLLSVLTATLRTC